MKHDRHTAEQINARLRDVETEPANGAVGALVWQRIGVSQQTGQPRRQTRSGVQIDPDERLKALERENNRLKKLVAEQAMDIDVLKELAQSVDNFGT